MPQTPHASTSRSTPSSGQTASGAVPTSMLPGPFQIAARTAPPPRLRTGGSVPVVRQLALPRDGSGALNDRVHLHAHARRRHALGRARGVRLDRRHRASATSAARTSGCPTEELAALMDDIRANGHETWIEVVSETEEDTLASARAAAEIRPDHLIGGTLIEPVQEILAGTGVQVLALRRADRRPSVPAARLDRRDRRRHGARRRARRRRHQPARLPLRRRRRGARARRRRRHRPAGHLRRLGRLRSSASARSRPAARGRFTIGTAALDGALVEGAPLSGQLQAALEAAGGARRARGAPLNVNGGWVGVGSERPACVCPESLSATGVVVAGRPFARLPGSSARHGDRRSASRPHRLRGRSARTVRRHRVGVVVPCSAVTPSSIIRPIMSNFARLRRLSAIA